ncbi:MAG: tol-pal system protein YbgF [Gammaproteobacteria bacterium]|nr:tol-pal system protein YbgF [Gammaproteobacteria bacterium]MDE2345942.1 tol-pal system protein YbgF [Gammaproteobacteria bacterium]
MKTRLWIGIAACLAGLLGGCSTTVKPDDPVYIRQQQLEARVDRLDQIFNNQSLANLSQNIDNLQQQINDLRGDIQVLQHDQQLTNKQQRDLYSDLDKRLQKLEMSLTSNASTPAAGATTQISAAGTTSNAATSGGDQTAYQRNFNLLKQGRYEDAINGFTNFIQQYPQSPLVPNAEFWMGECHYQMSDFQGALVNYQAVLKGYPNSNKAPDALLKVGYSQYEMQRYADARKTLDSVIKRYPGTNVANLARQRLQRMRKEGH